jgi:hypothetical protein
MLLVCPKRESNLQSLDSRSSAKTVEQQTIRQLRRSSFPPDRLPAHQGKPKPSCR